MFGLKFAALSDRRTAVEFSYPGPSLRFGGRKSENWAREALATSEVMAKAMTATVHATRICWGFVSHAKVW